MKRVNILISIPEDFTDRFLAFINNVNAVNVDIGTSDAPIKIKKIYDEPIKNIAAIPTNKENGENIEDKN